MKYYEVCAKCGHVGRKYYVVKSFAIKAEDGRMAAAKARSMPRVKHDHKDAIISVCEIDIDDFARICQMTIEDPYFQCKNIQDQRRICGNLKMGYLKIIGICQI